MTSTIIMAPDQEFSRALTRSHDDRPVVLHLFNEFCPGPSAFRYQIVANPEVRSAVYCTRRTDAELFPWSEVYVAHAVHRLRRWTAFGSKLAAKLANMRHRATWRQCLLRFRPEVVHVQFGDKAVRLLPLLQGAGVPFVVTFHGSDINTATFSRRYCSQLRALFTEAAGCHFVSRDLADQAIELGCPREKASVNHLGVPVGAAQSLGSCRTDDCVFTCVASLLPCKGHETLLRAFAEVRGQLPGVTLRLFGTGWLRDRLEWLAESLQLQEAVFFHGEMPHVAVQKALAEETDVVVLASQRDDHGCREGLPISLNEAGGLGLPVVATRCGGIPELVLDGITGSLVDQRDANALSDRMIHLALNPDLRRRMGHAARSRVSQEFNLERQHIAFAELYRRVTHAS